MKESVRELFARRVKEMRAKRGWSQDELAARSGLHRSYVGIIERCEKSATLDTVERIAKAFGVKAGELFED
jgi:transcriptional regulator with XRE-family HTH domain